MSKTQKTTILACGALTALMLAWTASLSVAAEKIIHDAEYYILEAQNGKVWAVEDGELDKKLAELHKKYDAPPNIVHYMWDDQPPMSFGVRYIRKSEAMRHRSSIN